MNVYLAEIIGTAILILLGNGVVANVLLSKTKGHSAGTLFITIGWALAVLIPALIFGEFSGAHFNPALTIALAVMGNFEWALVPGYIASQFTGAIIGAVLVWLYYKDHFDATEDKDLKLACFSTGPNIRNLSMNFISELIGTFILVFAIVGIGNTMFADGLQTFGVGGIILVIGISLGGTTGYAINPCRDLGPRIAYAFLPIKDKRNPDWGYALIPVLGPIAGALAAAFLAMAIF